MKKTIKSSVVAVIMVLLLLSLTGCGGDKIVVTKDDDDMPIKMEISFKKDVADKVKITVEAPSKDDAKDGVEFFKKQFGEDAKVKASGKNVIIETNIKDMFKSMGLGSIDDENLSKDKITEALKQAGFDVKE